MQSQKLVKRKRPEAASKPAGGLTGEALDAMTRDFALLAHPVRLQILDVLARGEGLVCVSDLEQAVPVNQPTVSHHLRLLREAGLVGSEKRGLWAYYFVNGEAVAALKGRVVAGLEALGAPQSLLD